jgi:hypothetical protein
VLSQKLLGLGIRLRIEVIDLLLPSIPLLFSVRAIANSGGIRFLTVSDAMIQTVYGLVKEGLMLPRIFIFGLGSEHFNILFEMGNKEIKFLIRNIGVVMRGQEPLTKRIRIRII